MPQDLLVLSPEKTVLSFNVARIGSRIGAHLIDLGILFVTFMILSGIACDAGDPTGECSRISERCQLRPRGDEYVLRDVVGIGRRQTAQKNGVNDRSVFFVEHFERGGVACLRGANKLGIGSGRHRHQKDAVEPFTVNG